MRKSRWRSLSFGESEIVWLDELGAEFTGGFVGVVSVVDGDGDEFGAGLAAGSVVVVVVVSVVVGDCAVVEHAPNPPLKKRAAIANPPHIFGRNVAGFGILVRFFTGATEITRRFPPHVFPVKKAALPTTMDLAWL